jgi:antitoxin VapB
MAHETKTEAIRRALVERRARLRASGKGSRKGLEAYLEKHIWPFVPPSELGRVLTRQEEDEILGYGPNGY